MLYCSFDIFYLHLHNVIRIELSNLKEKQTIYEPNKTKQTPLPENSGA
jgi:hypothetical protein